MRLLALTALALGCAATPRIPDRPPDIVGIVTHVQTPARPDAPARVRVETNPDEPSGSPKMVLDVGRETRLLDRRAAGEPRTIGPDALRVGDRVEAWVTGPVRESYPSQAAAEAIVVVGSSPDRAP